MPEHEIIVQGDAVLLVERRVLKAVSVDSFLSQASATAIHHTGVLPRGCISVTRRNSRVVAVLEVPAKVMPLMYRNNAYRVSLPFIQYFLTLMSIGGKSGAQRYKLVRCALSCTKKPIETLSDPVQRAPLPNVFDDGRVCLGDIPFVEGPLKTVAADLLQKFWGSPFNRDTGLDFPHFHTNRKDIAGTLAAWKKATEDNNFFAIEDSTKYYPHSGMTFEGVIATCLS